MDAGVPVLGRRFSRTGSSPVDRKGEQGRWQSVRHARDAVAHDLYSFRGGLVGARRSRRLAVPL